MMVTRTTSATHPRRASILIGVLAFIGGGLVSMILFSYLNEISKVLTLDVPGHILYEIQGGQMRLKLLEEDKSVIVLERENERVDISVSPMTIRNGLTVSDCGKYVFGVGVNGETNKHTIMKLTLPEKGDVAFHPQ